MEGLNKLANFSTLLTLPNSGKYKKSKLKPRRKSIYLKAE